MSVISYKEIVGKWADLASISFAIYWLPASLFINVASRVIINYRFIIWNEGESHIHRMSLLYIKQSQILEIFSSVLRETFGFRGCLETVTRNLKRAFFFRSESMTGEKVRSTITWTEQISIYQSIKSLRMFTSGCAVKISQEMVTIVVREKPCACICS